MAGLRELARAIGLEPDYTSWRGEPTSSTDDSVLAALHALAPTLELSIESLADADKALELIERRRWTTVAPPVVLAWDGVLELPFTVPAAMDLDWEVEVSLEDGGTVRAHGRLFDLPADGHGWPGGVVHCVRRARIGLEGQLGYHTVKWTTAGTQGEAFVIAAPRRAWGAPGMRGKRWGVFAPVYGLANARTGQAGDLGSLRQLFDAVARRGGRYVSTLPILAAFLDEPYAFSPYSPASRLYWNELYLDLDALAAELGVAAPVAPPIVPDLPIDYRAQYHWRRRELDAMVPAVLAHRGHAAEIAVWARQTGAYDYAAFRAIAEHERTGWRSWPAALRDGAPFVHSRGEAIALGADGARVDTHVVAQYLMQQQLEALRHGSVSLYLDLPVGVNCDAYEVWRWRELFLLDLAAGAPPDALFLGGQNWGLPPLAPAALRRDRYNYFIKCVRHHLSVAGMLRIDHVMGLFRLYCVPQGRPATDGVYIKYPAEELLAVLTLESMRAKCALAGEDLGTVPEGVRPAMTAHGLFRLHVGQWSFPSVPGQAPTPAFPEAVGSLNTHDTATFAGWWRGADIDDKRSLGLIEEPAEREERAQREREKTAIMAMAAPSPTDTLTEVERAMVAVTTDLAVGPAEVVLVSLDDLALDPVPHNVPGTVSERPNWQRRVHGWAEALDPERAGPAAAAAIAALTTAR